MLEKCAAAAVRCEEFAPHPVWTAVAGLGTRVFIEGMCSYFLHSHYGLKNSLTVSSAASLQSI